MKTIIVAALAFLISAGTAHAAVDAFLKLDGVKGESTDASITTVTTEDSAPTRTSPPPSTATLTAPPPPPQAAGADYLLELDGIKGESEDKKKGKVETNWKVEEGEKGDDADEPGDIRSGDDDCDGRADDSAAGTEDCDDADDDCDGRSEVCDDDEEITPDFSILLGGGDTDEDCDDSGKDGADRKTEDCDDADDDAGPANDDKLTGLARARQVLIDNAKASDQAIETISFNFSKMEVKYNQDVKLFGFIPTIVKATVEIDAEEQVSVKFPWWAIFVSGTDDSIGESVFTTLSNVLKTKHDTIKNSIGNIR